MAFIRYDATGANRTYCLLRQVRPLAIISDDRRAVRFASACANSRAKNRHLAHCDPQKISQHAMTPGKRKAGYQSNSFIYQ
jgi:hypothetical protein